MPGRCPSFTMESLWQTPHASTLMRTQPGPGAGMGTSTTSRSPPARFTRAARIVVAMSNSPWVVESSCAESNARRQDSVFGKANDSQVDDPGVAPQFLERGVGRRGVDREHA